MTEITDAPPTWQSNDPLETEIPDTKWPRVIGTISIIYAIAGLACQVLAVGSVFLTKFLMSLGGMDIETPGIMKLTTAGMAVFMTGLGFLMLAGGIALVRRRPAGISRLKTWAILRIVMILVGVGITIATLPANIQFQASIAEATNEKMREGGNTQFIKEFDEDATWTQAVIMTGVMSGLAAVYPLFIAFYLSRRKISDEVALW